MSTKTTQDALKSSIVSSPNVTMFIQIKFKSFSRLLSKRVKVLSVGVDVHRYLMLPWTIVGVCVTHQQKGSPSRQFTRKSVDCEDTEKHFSTSLLQ